MPSNVYNMYIACRQSLPMKHVKLPSSKQHETFCIEFCLVC